MSFSTDFYLPWLCFRTAAVSSAGHPFTPMSMMPAGEAQMYRIFGPPHGPSLANFGEPL
jgi:hypothetical protein